MKLSDELREAVVQGGGSQASIARSCRITPSSLSRFLSGESGLSLNALDRLAEYMGLRALPQHLAVSPPNAPAVTTRRTDRLIVFAFNTLLNPSLPVHRRVYIAFSRDLELPSHLVAATVMLPTPYFRGAVDWIETATKSRREGYATELLRLIVSDCPGVMIDGATRAGEAFCSAFERTNGLKH